MPPNLGPGALVATWLEAPVPRLASVVTVAPVFPPVENRFCWPSIPALLDVLSPPGDKACGAARLGLAAPRRGLVVRLGLAFGRDGLVALTLLVLPVVRVAVAGRIGLLPDLDGKEFLDCGVAEVATMLVEPARGPGLAATRCVDGPPEGPAPCRGCGLAAGLKVELGVVADAGELAE